MQGNLFPALPFLGNAPSPPGIPKPHAVPQAYAPWGSSTTRGSPNPTSLLPAPSNTHHETPQWGHPKTGCYLLYCPYPDRPSQVWTLPCPPTPHGPSSLSQPFQEGSGIEGSSSPPTHPTLTLWGHVSPLDLLWMPLPRSGTAPYPHLQPLGRPQNRVPSSPPTSHSPKGAKPHLEPLPHAPHLRPSGDTPEPGPSPSRPPLQQRQPPAPLPADVPQLRALQRPHQRLGLGGQQRRRPGGGHGGVASLW